MNKIEHVSNLSSYRPEEITIIENQPDVPLHDFWTASIDTSISVAIDMHRATPATSDNKVSLTRIAESYRPAFKKLAEYLRTDVRFKDLRYVTLTSWVLTELPDIEGILSVTGFEVDKKGRDPLGKNLKEYYKRELAQGRFRVPAGQEGTEPGFAKMEVEKFINRYGG